MTVSAVEWFRGGQPRATARTEQWEVSAHNRPFCRLGGVGADWMVIVNVCVCVAGVNILGAIEIR